MNPIQADSLDFVYIGQLIRKYRVNNGYTQAHLADMVNIDASHISKIERGKKVRLSTLVSISSALGFSLDEIKRSSFQKEAGISDEVYIMLMGLSEIERKIFLAAGQGGVDGYRKSQQK